MQPMPDIRGVVEHKCQQQDITCIHLEPLDLHCKDDCHAPQAYRSDSRMSTMAKSLQTGKYTEAGV